jgi:hypothetical protein
MDTALRLPQPGQAFRDLVLELAREGYEKKQILQFLEEFLIQLREKKEHKESDEDIILDTMDCLVGWSHPQARLLRDRD